MSAQSLNVSPLPTGFTLESSEIHIGGAFSFIRDSGYMLDEKLSAAAIKGTLLFKMANAPVIEPIVGEVTYDCNGGGGSTRPTTGMLYPRGQG